MLELAAVCSLLPVCYVFGVALDLLFHSHMFAVVENHSRRTEGLRVDLAVPLVYWHRSGDYVQLRCIADRCHIVDCRYCLHSHLSPLMESYYCIDRLVAKLAKAAVVGVCPCGLYVEVVRALKMGFPSLPQPVNVSVIFCDKIICQE